MEPEYKDGKILSVGTIQKLRFTFLKRFVLNWVDFNRQKVGVYFRSLVTFKTKLCLIQIKLSQ